MHPTLPSTRITGAGALISVTLLLTLAPAFASSPQVVYTYTIADLGQGAWGGGPLYADGSAGGNLPFSAENGQIIAHLKATSWTQVDSDSVDICFQVRQIKGPPFFPPSFCLSDFGFLLDVTGTPIIVNLFGEENTLLRLTPAN